MISAFSVVHVSGAIVVAVMWIAAFSVIREPARQKLSAIFIAGAGAAYLSGGFGVWEVAACGVFTGTAYGGLTDYRWIGLGWFLHTCWDLAHHFYGNPILPFQPTSSAGCAVCDLLLAWWYCAGAPSVYRKMFWRTAEQ